MGACVWPVAAEITVSKDIVAMSEVLDTFNKLISIAMDDEGVYPHQGVGLKDDGLTIFAIAVRNSDEWKTFLQQHIGDFKELVCSLDISTKPDQGTKYDDALIVFHWTGSDYKIGVINYKPEVIEPIDWNNPYWPARMREFIGDLA